jgi:hypothetical protein
MKCDVFWLINIQLSECYRLAEMAPKEEFKQIPYHHGFAQE